MLDFDALGKGGSGAKVIEPQKIFTTLIRNSRFKFPSANQGEVLDRWFDKRSRRDNTIKMNTGSGKMLVGLLAVCTENLIRVDAVMESPKLAE
jgi:superfamily II DNA or RNA helicase